jgi:hypothetical protein
MAVDVARALVFLHHVMRPAVSALGNWATSFVDWAAAA